MIERLKRGKEREDRQERVKEKGTKIERKEEEIVLREGRVERMGWEEGARLKQIQNVRSPHKEKDKNCNGKK